jgi:hypothetical protein
MPLEGSLKELSLTSIIQLNCNEMNTATVSLLREGKEGIICFAEGAIVHAVVEDVVGEEAVYELLSWPDGSFVVQQGQEAPEKTISSNWNSLLLEGVRRLDEQESQTWDSVEVELAAEPSDNGDDMTRLARELKMISGVEGTVIISHDGVVFASDLLSLSVWR